jgi:hypothetical protein
MLQRNYSAQQLDCVEQQAPGQQSAADLEVASALPTSAIAATIRNRNFMMVSFFVVVLVGQCGRRIGYFLITPQVGIELSYGLEISFEVCTHSFRSIGQFAT